IRDEEDFTWFLLKQLNKGYKAWLCADERIVSLVEEIKIPLCMSQSWKEWRTVLLPVVRQWLEEYTDYHERKPRRGTFYHQCNKLIERVLATLPKDASSWP